RIGAGAPGRIGLVVADESVLGEDLARAVIHSGRRVLDLDLLAADGFGFGGGGALRECQGGGSSQRAAYQERFHVRFLLKKFSASSTVRVGRRSLRAEGTGR